MPPLSSLRCLFSLILLAGCGGGSLGRVDDDKPKDKDKEPVVDTDTDSAVEAPIDDAVPDYRFEGFQEWTETTRSIPAATCAMEVDVYEPDVVLGPIVVLSHGFQRNKAQMADWARHLASWGIPVLAPQLCHASVLDTNHPENGQDLAAIGAWTNKPVVYAGHSAGGVAALLAGKQDPTVLGVIGLDLTDSNHIARDAASAVSVPIYGLVGEPSTCNSSGNGVAVYRQAPDARVTRLTEADHCDFESPTDWGCTTLCAGPERLFEDAVKRENIAALLTGAVFATKDDATRKAWWSPNGTYWSYLAYLGAVSPL